MRERASCDQNKRQPSHGRWDILNGWRKGVGALIRLTIPMGMFGIMDFSKHAMRSLTTKRHQKCVVHRSPNKCIVETILLVIVYYVA